MIIKSNPGFCVICEKEVEFVENNAWLRDYYTCNICKSIPRNRAIIVALNTLFPVWKTLNIHESSPGGASSDYFKRNCINYTESQFFKDMKYGLYKNGVRCENLECMTFDDETFDIFVTQDVFEHVLNPAKAFYEISRVLKQGGIHIFTMPWYSDNKETIQRVREESGDIVYLQEPVYHGNPIDKDGSIVTYDWGLDFIDYVYKHSKMTTMVYLYKNRELGLDGEFLHVFISFKSHKSKVFDLRKILKKQKSLLLSYRHILEGKLNMKYK